MAQIIEDNIVIKVSRLVKSGTNSQKIVTPETLQALEQVTQELLGTDVIVEAESVQ